MITIRYEILTFSLVRPFFKEGGRGFRKFWSEAEIFGIFSIEVASYPCQFQRPLIYYWFELEFLFPTLTTSLLASFICTLCSTMLFAINLCGLCDQYSRYHFVFCIVTHINVPCLLITQDSSHFSTRFLCILFNDVFVIKTLF